MTFEELPPMEESCQNCKGTGQLDYTYEMKVGKKDLLNYQSLDPKDSIPSLILSKPSQKVIRDLERYEPYDRQRD